MGRALIVDNKKNNKKMPPDFGPTIDVSVRRNVDVFGAR
jgi:hypothetical protein